VAATGAAVVAIHILKQPYKSFHSGFNVVIVGNLTLREKQNSPSVTCFLKSQKSSTLGRQSSPSVALREEMHSGKGGFPECWKGHDTRGRKALGEGHLPRVQHSAKSGTRKIKFAFDGGGERNRRKKIFPECLALALGEAILFPECLTLSTWGSNCF
jgi:hypothetical protein